MTLPFTLPDWLPWWAGIVVIVPVALFLLAFLFMPFSIFGVKGRLEGVEARLDEIQGEIRSLALRLPERGDDLGPAPRARAGAWAEPERPPIPPRAVTRFETDRAVTRSETDRAVTRQDTDHPSFDSPETDRPAPPSNRRVDPARGGRAEPRLGPR